MTDATPPASFSRVRQINRKIRPPRPKKKADIAGPGFDDIICHRRNPRRTRYYLTSGHEHLGEPRDVNAEQSPFVFPPCSSMFAYFQYWKAWRAKAAKERRVAGYQNQQNFKTSQTQDLLRRLRVDVEIEAEEAKKHKDPDKAIAMTDVDPQYFTELAGRVVREKFSLQQYIDDNREIFKTRLLTGQQRDDCIRIEQQFQEEERRLEKIKSDSISMLHRFIDIYRHSISAWQYRGYFTIAVVSLPKRQYRRYVSGFEEFLSKDHERSMEVLEKAEKETKLTNEITERRNQLSKEFGQVRLDVYVWEENWRMVKMCQKFLYQVSPISWRMQYDWIHRSESGETITSASADHLFGRYKMIGEVASLDTLISLFQQDITDAGPTEIYFEDPFELIRVFRAMETQNLNALIHLESLAGPMSDMATTITTAEEQIKSEVSEIQDNITDLENAIRETEERAEDLEEYANELLKGVFRELVCSQEVLCLRVYIEDAYESCVAPNDANLDSFSMMKALEKIHEELNLILDTLPQEVVQACAKEGFKQEMKAMKDTEEAAKKASYVIIFFHEQSILFEQSGEENKPRNMVLHLITPS
ncbi:hypothetical protein KM043_011953 [Ampulex compressa]|nr:hypothetical protein KM043_011953 [Ampulex compressa]